mgnify:CR=1 FL=1
MGLQDYYYCTFPNSSSSTDMDASHDWDYWDHHDWSLLPPSSFCRQGDWGGLYHRTHNNNNASTGVEESKEHTYREEQRQQEQERVHHVRYHHNRS